MIMTPSVIAAIAGLKNGHQIKSIDEKLYRHKMQDALDQIREKSNGENLGSGSGGQKGKVKSPKKGQVKNLPE